MEKALHRRRWFLVTLCWLIWGAFHASRLRIDIPGIDWPTAFAYALPDALLWALLTPIPVYLGRRLPIQAGQVIPHGAMHLAVALLVAVVHSLADTVLNVLLALVRGAPIDFTEMFGHLLFYSFHINVILYLAIVGIVQYIERAKSLQERERQASELRAQLSQARLEALRMQLRPHFLFNALHTISGLMEQDPRTGQKVVRQLGDLLRMSLSARDTPEISLEEELDFARAYLEIERARFRDRLDTRIDADADALTCGVPPFILQPIIENAVRHGIAQLQSGGRVEVSAVCRNGRLELRVSDNGPGLAAGVVEAKTEASGGIGIANTRARLRELYGQRHEFRMETGAEGGMTVTMILPRHVDEVASR